MAIVIRSVALTLANHKHSKAYAASIESVEGGGSAGRSYIVCSTYGAIGSIQKPGKGPPQPVTLEAAEKFYNKLVTEKTTIPCSCCAGLYVITGAAAATSTFPLASAAAISRLTARNGSRGRRSSSSNRRSTCSGLCSPSASCMTW